MKNNSSITQCEECGEDVFQDTVNGQYVCRGCGLIQSIKMIIPSVAATERYYPQQNGVNVTHHYRTKELVDHPLVKQLGTDFDPKAARGDRYKFERLRRQHKSSTPSRPKSRKNTLGADTDVQKQKIRLLGADAKKQSGDADADADDKHLISDGVFRNDFLKICKHFNIPVDVHKTGIVIIERLLRTPKKDESKLFQVCQKCHKENDTNEVKCTCGASLERFASRGDTRSMNSIRISRRWAAALVIYLVDKFQNRYGFLSKLNIKEIVDFALIRISEMNTARKKIRRYERLFLKIFAPDLRKGHNYIPPSKSVDYFLPSDKFPSEIRDLTRSVLKVTERVCLGKNLRSLISASCAYAHQLIGTEFFSEDIAAVGSVTAVTLRSNLSALNQLFGTFSILGSKNKVSTKTDQGWLAQYCSLHYHIDHNGEKTYYINDTQLAKIPSNLKVGNVILVNPTPYFDQLRCTRSITIQSFKAYAEVITRDIKNYSTTLTTILDSSSDIGTDQLKSHYSEIQAGVTEAYNNFLDITESLPPESQVYDEIITLKHDIEVLHQKVQEKLRVVARDLTIRENIVTELPAEPVDVTEPITEINIKQTATVEHLMSMTNAKSTGWMRLAFIHQCIQMGQGFHQQDEIQTGNMIQNYEDAMGKKVRPDVYYTVYRKAVFMEATHPDATVHRILDNRVTEKDFFRNVGSDKRNAVCFKISDDLFPFISALFESAAKLNQTHTVTPETMRSVLKNA